MTRVDEANPPEPTVSWGCSLASETEMQQLAAVFAHHAQPPLTIWLRGDLGTGKTTFARAYVHALGFEGYVKSPSYGLLETYALEGQTVLHLDLYRIEDPEELEYLAIRDLYDGRSVLLVEWPDRGEGHLPPADLVLEFRESEPGRFVQCTGVSEAGKALAHRLVEQVLKHLRQLS